MGNAGKYEGNTSMKTTHDNNIMLCFNCKLFPKAYVFEHLRLSCWCLGSYEIFGK